MVCMGLRVRLQRHTQVFRYIKSYGGKFLKRISMYCTKCKEINMRHSEVQKHASFTGSPGRMLIYYGLYLETTGNVL